MKAIVNRFDKDCACCGCHVTAGDGYAVVSDNVWNTYCRSSRCLPTPVYRQLTGRSLTVEGKVYMPYDAAALEWLRKFPGARFVKPTDGGQAYWQVSLRPEHRRKVLDIASILKLEVAPELLQYADPEADNAAALQLAIERGRAVGAYPYQLMGIRFISERERCLIGDEPGLGKTLMSLISIPEKYGTLVVVPATLKYNWQVECKKWRPDLTPRVLHSSSLPAVLWPPAGEVWIINPDALPAEPPAPTQRDNPLFIIEDEAHLYKNTKTKRHKSVFLWNLAASKVCIMTGTPMTNRPMDLWGTLQVAGLAVKAFGSKAAFKNMFELTDRGELVNPRPEVPRRLRSVMLRRTQDEVLKELPPAIHTQHIVSKVIPPALAEQLDEAYEKVEAALNMNDLPHIEQMSMVRALLASFKVTEMHELIEGYEENDTPLVVFSAHKDPVLSAAARPGWAAITGETKNEDRQRVVEDFQAGKLKGVALTVQAGGVGLTLTRAAHMLFVDLDWTPAMNAQAEARIKRIGQKAAHVHYTTMVVQHPVDARVLQLLEHKTKLFRQSIDAVADEYKVPSPETREARITGTFQPSSDGRAMPFEETDEQWQARIAANKARRAQVLARHPAIQHDRAMHTEAVRRRNALDAAPQWLQRERKVTPAYQFRLIDPDRLRDALAFMLGRCDGARTKDDAGFNANDAYVARHAIYLDIERNHQHAEIVARLLYKYKRQLSGVLPELFEQPQYEVQHAAG